MQGHHLEEGPVDTELTPKAVRGFEKLASAASGAQPRVAKTCWQAAMNKKVVKHLVWNGVVSFGKVERKTHAMALLEPSLLRSGGR